MVDLKGKKFGRLQVLAKTRAVKYDSGAVHWFWLCHCDCGTEKEIRGPSLSSGATVSCGCRRKEASSENAKKVNTLPIGEATRRAVLGVYKKAASDRDLEWALTDVTFYDLVARPCFYCGELASNRRHSRSGNGDFIYNGIDRWDNTKGYLEGNVVPCCAVCNKMKGVLTHQEFLFHIHKIQACSEAHVNSFR